MDRTANWCSGGCWVTLAVKLKAMDFTRVIRACEAKVSTNLVLIKAHR
jgi:hypothetical protein